MNRRIVKEGAPAPQAAPRAVRVPIDVTNEQVILAACIVDPATHAALAPRVKPDSFFGSGHASAWEALGQLRRQGLDYSPATLRQMTAGAVDVDYLERLVAAHPKKPPNLAHHVEMLEWDRARANAASGPLDALLKAIQDPTTRPEAVRAMSKNLAAAFDGWGDRRHLLDPNELVRSQMAEVRKRKLGMAVYSYGIEGLDEAAEGAGTPIIPGAAPGQVTVVTGVPGTAKSTFTARVVLGLEAQGRRVLYGAWEMSGGTTLELLAAMSLGLSRTRCAKGLLTEDEEAELEAEMNRLSARVRFLANWRAALRAERGKRRPANDENLDRIHGYISDTGCDVAVFDLWKRILAYTDPDDEEQALIQQQAIAEETKTHCILVQQQRMKDVEQRVDKRPTREGIKGSGAWIEVPDTIVGMHRPALWKRVDDTTAEAIFLKQRGGKWPFAVEFDWDGEHGSFANPRAVPYDPPGAEESSNEMDAFLAEGTSNRRRRR